MAKTITFKETKALQAFEGSIRTLNQHIQLVDRSLLIANKIVKKDAKSKLICEALGCTVDTHPQLNVPCSSIDISRVYTTSRKKIHEQAIVDLYRFFSRYIKDLIEEFMHTDPMPLLQQVCGNKDNTINYAKIISIGDYGKIIEFMANSIFRKFENERSTTKLLDKILSYTKINIDSEVKENALLYLEIRHLIIHNRSLADDNFMTRANGKLTIHANKKLPINYEMSSSAIKKVCELCRLIDKELVANHMVRERCIVHNK